MYLRRYIYIGIDMSGHNDLYTVFLYTYGGRSTVALARTHNVLYKHGDTLIHGALTVT